MVPRGPVIARKKTGKCGYGYGRTCHVFREGLEFIYTGEGGRRVNGDQLVDLGGLQLAPAIPLLPGAAGPTGQVRSPAVSLVVQDRPGRRHDRASVPGGVVLSRGLTWEKLTSFPTVTSIHPRILNAVEIPPPRVAPSRPAPRQRQPSAKVKMALRTCSGNADQVSIRRARSAGKPARSVQPVCNRDTSLPGSACVRMLCNASFSDCRSGGCGFESRRPRF